VLHYTEKMGDKKDNDMQNMYNEIYKDMRTMKREIYTTSESSKSS